MMFRRQEVLFTLLSLALLASGTAYIFRSTPHDDVAYHQLMESSDEREPSSKPVSYEMLQKRIGVSKEFVLFNLETAVQDDKVIQGFELESVLMGGDHSQKVNAPPIKSDCGSKDCVNLSSSTAVSRFKGSDRLDYRLKSDTSDLTVDYQEGKSTVVEHLEQVHCLMQEALLPGDPPGQLVRSLQAARASYHYQTGELFAEKVKIERYRLPGHELGGPLEEGVLLMKGDAEEGTLSLSGKKPLLHAKEFQGVFLGPEAMALTAQTVDYDGEQSVMTGGVIMNHSLGKVSTAKVTLATPLISMEGNVLIELKEGGTLACERGVINHEKLQGEFYGSAPAGEVVYTDRSDLQTGDPSLTIRSQRMILETAGALTKCSLAAIDAYGKVTVASQNGFVTLSDQAHYRRMPSDFIVAMKLPGIITLRMDDEQGLCSASHRNGYKLLSKEITIDTLNERVVCSENTVLTFLDADKKEHVMACAGPLEIDNEQMTIVLKGSHEQQVVFQDDLGRLLANEATIHYVRQGQKKMEIEKISLEGNVKIYNKTKQTDEEVHGQQYALADQVTYVLNSNELNLTSQEGRRVLLFDEINHLQISAPALKIHRDKETKKDSFQGMGDVRFNFMEQEMDQIKELFNFSAKKEIGDNEK
jgi:lipopolysaccharide export system protein LptA